MTSTADNLESRQRRIAAGNGQARADVFLHFRPQLKRMVRLRLDRRLQGRVDPSDVLQEAYLQIFRRASNRYLRALKRLREELTRLGGFLD